MYIWVQVEIQGPEQGPGPHPFHTSVPYLFEGSVPYLVPYLCSIPLIDILLFIHVGSNMCNLISCVCKYINYTYMSTYP